MPDLDGFDTLTAIRANPETRDLAVIVLTGREDLGATAERAAAAEPAREQRA